MADEEPWYIRWPGPRGDEPIYRSRTATADAPPPEPTAPEPGLPANLTRGNPQYPPSDGEQYRRESHPTPPPGHEPEGPPAPGPPNPEQYPPAQYAGRTSTNSATGEQFVSDGKEWQPVRGREGAPGMATTTGPPTTGPVSPTLARGALTAFSPEAMLGKIGEAEAAGVAREKAIEEKGKAETIRVKDREIPLAEAQQAIADYRAEYAKARPTPPTLKETPPVPDVKIRPWLDPEGKNAIQVMVQGLGALAIAFSGVKYGAPMTAMQQFREMSEAWRRDEVDSANSKMNEFNLTVNKIKSDNEVALKNWEIVEQQYGHNIEAKKAAMVTRMEALGLHDKATEIAMLPYDQAILQTTARVENAKMILGASKDFIEVYSKWQKAKADMPTTIGGITGRIAALQDNLQDAKDPAEQTAIQRQIDVLNVQKQMMSQYQTTHEEARFGMQVAGREIPKAEEHLGRVTNLAQQVFDVDKAFKVIQQNGGVLPTSRTPVAVWLNEQRQRFRAGYPKEVAQALGVISRFGAEVFITFDRDVGNVRGNTVKQAYGLPKDLLMPYAEWQGARNYMTRQIALQDAILRDRIQTYKGLTSVPLASPSSAPLDDQE